MLRKHPIYLIDESYTIIDTITHSNEERYIRIREAILYKPNENHNNISVKFYLSDDGVSFTEFDWVSEACLSYNGRFSPIAGKGGTVKSGSFKIRIRNEWSGDIIYAMGNTSFLPVFGNKFAKLVVTIKDRALHTSNVMETPVFKLNDIR